MRCDRCGGEPEYALYTVVSTGIGLGAPVARYYETPFSVRCKNCLANGVMINHRAVLVAKMVGA